MLILKCIHCFSEIVLDFHLLNLATPGTGEGALLSSAWEAAPPKVCSRDHYAKKGRCPMEKREGACLGNSVLNQVAESFSTPPLKKFIYLFLALLGLHCCARAFSSCSERGLLFVVVQGLLIAVASRCGAWALGTQASVVVARGLSSCGSWAQ